MMAIANLNGAFSEEFAKRKTWKIDEGLLAALVATIPAGSSVIELGAGIGKYVSELNRHPTNDYKVCGVDGIPNIEELSDGVVKWKDLSTWDSRAPVWNRSDWAYCIEVGEHIPESKLKAFFRNLAESSNQGLIVSWGIPGQRGHDHVSCRLPEWVSCELGKRGWNLDHDKTMRARSIAGKGWDKKLMVFTR